MRRPLSVGSDRADHGDSIGPTSELAKRFRGYSLEPVPGGQSGAAVWRCTSPRLPVRYVKAAPLTANLRLDGEAERLKWMRINGVSVP
ncbi:MAG: hypothetical protein M3Y30_02805, partial [Gemmatimonadota bacterium]|nr:hypothetical protein [Gemmatimonadota bacterium]